MFFLGGLAVFFAWLREGHPWLNEKTQKITKRSATERNKKTDVRYIDDFLQAPQGEFDPRKYFKLNAFF